MSGGNILFLLIVLAGWLIPALIKAKARREKAMSGDMPKPPSSPSPPPKADFREEAIPAVFRQMLGIQEVPSPPTPEPVKIAEKQMSPPEPIRRPVQMPEEFLPKFQEKPAGDRPQPRLHFSDNPVIQGIIFSEILSPPPGLRQG